MQNHNIMLKQGLWVSMTFTAAASDLVTLQSGRELPDGFGPFRLSTSDTLPAGSAVDTNYWWIAENAKKGGWSNTGYFATSSRNAKQGTELNITDAGLGTHTLTPGVTSGGTTGVWYFPLPVLSDLASLHVGWHDGTSDCTIEIESTSLPARYAHLYDVDGEKWASVAVGVEGPTAATSAAGAAETPLVGLSANRHRLKVTARATTTLSMSVAGSY